MSPLLLLLGVCQHGDLHLEEVARLQRQIASLQTQLENVKLGAHLHVRHSWNATVRLSGAVHRLEFDEDRDPHAIALEFVNRNSKGLSGYEAAIQAISDVLTANDVKKHDDGLIIFRSQIWQDKILNQLFFKHRHHGIYVDVGSNHPYHMSNSFFFESRLNWNGLCIEANPQYAEKLRRHRTCTVIQAAASNQGGACNFTMANELGGLTQSYNAQHAERLRTEASENSWDVKYSEVKCVTLHSLFVEHDMKLVDLLSIDAEGAEMQVLQGIHFEHTHINVLDIECNYKEDTLQLDEFLQKRGFSRILSLKFDCIYANDHLQFSWDAKRKVLVDRGGWGVQAEVAQSPFVGIPIYLAGPRGKAPHMIMAPLDGEAEDVAADFTAQHDCKHVKQGVTEMVARLQKEATRKNEKAQKCKAAAGSATKQQTCPAFVHHHQSVRVVGTTTDESGVATFSGFGYNHGSISGDAKDSGTGG